MTADAVGGVWSYALDLSRALDALGIRVVLAVMGPSPSREQRAQAAAISSLELVESDHRLEWMDEPWADVARAGGWLLALERRYRPDVVHLNGYAHGVLPFRAPVLVVGHSCVLSWWEAVKGEPAPDRYVRYAEQVRAGLAAADLVVTPTRAMGEALERHYGPLPGRRVRVQANGCDLEQFVPRAKEPRIAAAGRVWDEAKNLEALARVARELPWSVCIAGAATSPLARAPASEPLGEAAPADAEFLGPLPRAALAALFGRASICAFPARYEPFGLSVLEAAACGAALVLGDVSSLRELWDGAARFVAPDDREGLVANIRELVLRGDEREAWAGRARERAQHFSLARFAQGYCDLYEELAAAGRKRLRESAQAPSARARSNALSNPSRASS